MAARTPEKPAKPRQSGKLGPQGIHDRSQHEFNDAHARSVLGFVRGSSARQPTIGVAPHLI